MFSITGSGTLTDSAPSIARFSNAAVMVIAIAAALLASCASGSPGPVRQPTGPLDTLPPLSELEALDTLGGPWHEASVVLDKTLLGDEAIMASALVELDFTAHVAVMLTSFDEHSYVIYRFTDFAPGEYPLSFSIERSDLGDGRTTSLPPPYSIAYAAWADFDAGRWRLFPDWMPYTDPPDSWVQLYPEDAAAVSLLGNSYLAVVLTGYSVESPEVRSVTLHYTGDAQ